MEKDDVIKWNYDGIGWGRMGTRMGIRDRGSRRSHGILAMFDIKDKMMSRTYDSVW